MTEIELKKKQQALLKEKDDWEELQSDYLRNSQKEEWHICSQEIQRLSEEIDNIRRQLFEMGCCE